MTTLEVVRPGPLTTIQDLGRPGLAHLGVSPSGAADRASLRLANRLVGNAEGTAALEVTFGGLVLRARDRAVVALTGGRCAADHNMAIPLPAGGELRLGPPASGVRTYVSVRGGFAATPVLGSRSRDVLAALGPAPLRRGDVLAVSEPSQGRSPVVTAPDREPPAGEVTLRVVPGPREDWFAASAIEALGAAAYDVTPDSNRVGVRLRGRPLERTARGELPSEGLARGAIQVPPEGQPVIFLADHPVTGGYPVIAVVVDADTDLVGQLRPGQRVRFSPAAPRS